MVRIFLSFLLFISVHPVTASAQDKEAIIAKYIEARGGLEKIRSLHSIIMTGVLQGPGIHYPVRFICTAGKGFKVEMQADDTIAFQLVNQTNGWTFFPESKDSKPAPMKAQDVKEAQDYLDLEGPLIDYQNKGNTIEYAGKEYVDSLYCYKLLVTKGDATVSTYYIDEQYNIYEIIKHSKDTTLEAETTTYINYKKTVEGIAFAFRWTVPGGYVTIDTIEINPAIPEEEFQFGKK